MQALCLLSVHTATGPAKGDACVMKMFPFILRNHKFPNEFDPLKDFLCIIQRIQCFALGFWEVTWIFKDPKLVE